MVERVIIEVSWPANKKATHCATISSSVSLLSPCSVNSSWAVNMSCIRSCRLVPPSLRRWRIISKAIFPKYPIPPFRRITNRRIVLMRGIRPIIRRIKGNRKDCLAFVRSVSSGSVCTLAWIPKAVEMIISSVSMLNQSMMFTILPDKRGFKMRWLKTKYGLNNLHRR